MIMPQLEQKENTKANTVELLLTNAIKVGFPSFHLQRKAYSQLSSNQFMISSVRRVPKYFWLISHLIDKGQYFYIILLASGF